MQKIILIAIVIVIYSCHSTTNTGSYNLNKKEITSPSAVHIEKDSSKKDLWVYLNEDKVRGDKYLMSIDPIIISNSDTSQFIRISFTKPIPGKTFWVDLRVYGGGSCIDDAGEIDILFNDSTRTKIFNHFKFNCDNAAVEYFRGAYENGNALKMLETKRISTVRVYTYKSSVTLNLTKENSYDFINTINWIDKSK